MREPFGIRFYIFILIIAIAFMLFQYYDKNKEDDFCKEKGFDLAVGKIWQDRNMIECVKINENNEVIENKKFVR